MRRLPPLAMKIVTTILLSPLLFRWLSGIVIKRNITV